MLFDADVTTFLWCLRLPGVVCVRGNGDNLLVLAVMSGSVPTCQHLVKSGLQVDAIVGKISITALAASAYHGQLDVVKYLVEDSGATIELPLSGGRFTTALEAASSDRNLVIARYLVEKKPGIDLTGAIVKAACSDNPDTVRFLLDAGADVNGELLRGHYGSALAAAAAESCYDVAKLLIHKGAKVNQQLSGEPYGSALIAAAQKPSNLPTIQLLMCSGANVNLVLKGGTYPNALLASLSLGGSGYDNSQYPAGLDLYKNFQYLASQGASVNSIFKSDIPAIMLALATCSYHRDLVDDLTRDGEPDIQRVVQEGILVRRLAECLIDDRQDVVKTLIQVGTDVNATLWRNWFGSCVELVAASGATETERAAFLIESGANVNLVSKRGLFGTALTAAAGYDNCKMVAFLLKHLGDPNLRPPHAFLETPLMMAAFSGAYNCAEALLKAGADVNLSVDRGKFRNALHVAESQDLDSANDWWWVKGKEEDDILNGRKKVKSLLQRWGKGVPSATHDEDDDGEEDRNGDQ